MSETSPPKAPSPKILTLPELVEVREKLRAEGKSVVQCHGCFDIVHPGHIRYLAFAREQGDALVVTVSSDEVVGKGVDRPYIHEELRLENLAAFEVVDYVCLDGHSWAGPVLEAVKPDVYVKGKEYENKGDPRFAREKELVEDYGGKVIFSSGEVVYSSTSILSEFRERFRMEGEKTRFYCRRHGVGREGLGELLAAARGRSILVVGDPILDHYVDCDASQLASESPILDVTPMKDDWFLGAGALIALQVTALGGRAGFLTAHSGDPFAERLEQGLEEAGIALHTVSADERPIYVKTRYLVDEKKVFKVNRGRYAPLSSVASRELAAMLERVLADYDGLLVTDFGYGLFGGRLVAAVCEIAARSGKPYFVDVSRAGRANLLRFSKPRLATPTEEELRFAFADQESGLSNLASRYYTETSAEGLIITLGKRGAVLFEPPEEGATRLGTDYLPSLVRHPVDTVGAGDVFLSTLALGCLAEAPLAAGMYLASCAAGLHTSRMGNTPVDLVELERYLDGRDELTVSGP